MKNYLLLALGLLSATTAVAQRTATDYVVTTAGDTLRGRIFVSTKRAGRVTLHRPDGTHTQLGPSEVRSYGDQAGVMGVSQPVGARRELRFVQPLVEGPSKLYSGRNSDNDKRYYLQTPDTTYLVELVPHQAQLSFHRLLTGCPTLEFGTNEAQRRYPLTYVGMTRLVTTYNTCKYPQQPSTVLKSSVGLRLGYGLKVGVNHSGFGLSFDAYPTPAQQQTGYQAGIFMRATNKSHVSLQLEALYTQLQAVYQAQNTSGQRTVRINYAQVQLPLLMRYTAGVGAIRPFLTAGFMLGVNLRNRSTDVLTYSSNSRSETPITSIGNWGIGATGGIGTVLKFAHMPEMSVEARYDRMRYNDYVFYTPQHSSLRLEFSVMLHDRQ